LTDCLYLASEVLSQLLLLFVLPLLLLFLPRLLMSAAHLHVGVCMWLPSTYESEGLADIGPCGSPLGLLRLSSFVALIA
jgi:hypothetical protein